MMMTVVAAFLVVDATVVVTRTPPELYHAAVGVQPERLFFFFFLEFPFPRRRGRRSSASEAGLATLVRH